MPKSLKISLTVLKVFAKTNRSFSRLKARKLDRALRRTVRNLNKRTEDYQPELSEQEITIEELDRVINEAGLNKAAGNDEISYELIKNLGLKGTGRKRSSSRYSRKGKIRN